MTRGVLIVESRPSSAAEAAAFHAWYDDTHIPQMLAVDGFVAARRYDSRDGTSFLTVYEIEGEVEAAKAQLAAAHAAGVMTRPVGLQLDPPPSARYFSEIG